ncbi:MAG: SoxR reducing system RseC family protein [Desulfobacterales bacterium]|jgi:sigma-E factor negative regulatory protein RseC|nr:SoxR reducing system RseC family protein [Desulfobacterales bacterium]
MSQERIEFGEIVATDGRTAQVRMKRSSQCAACSCAGLCSPFGKDWMVVAADNTLGAAAGQKVRITYRVAGEVKASFILYIVPVFALLLGALLGSAIDPFHNTDLSAVAAGLSFVVVSFLLIRKYAAWKYGRNRSYHPRISEVLSGPER